MNPCYAILTSLGQSMVAEAIRINAPINLQQMAIGDADYTPSEGQTELMNERARFDIIEITRDENNPSWLRVMTVIPPDVGGWHIHELGIFAENGNLFAIAKLDGAYKPVFSDGMLKEIALDIVLEVSSEANVHLVVDPNVIIATRKWVEEYVGVKFDSLGALFDAHIKRTDNPHGVTAAQAGAYSYGEADAKYQDIIRTATNHYNNTNNPHDTTAAQVGAYSYGEADAKYQDIIRTATNHYNNTNNPHGTTAAQVGAYSKAETDAKDSAISTTATAHYNNKNNPHGTTAALVGAYSKAEVSALLKETINSLDPIGITKLFSGAVGKIPPGYQLANGTNGTFDARDRYIVGAGGKYTAGQKIGQEKHSHTGSAGTVQPTTLTVNQMPSHLHKTYDAVNGSGGPGVVSAGPDGSTGWRDSQSAGGSQSHTHGFTLSLAEDSNLPPGLGVFVITRTSIF